MRATFNSPTVEVIDSLTEISLSAFNVREAFAPADLVIEAETVIFPIAVPDEVVLISTLFPVFNKPLIEVLRISELLLMVPAS